MPPALIEVGGAYCFWVICLTVCHALVSCERYLARSYNVGEITGAGKSIT